MSKCFSIRSKSSAVANNYYDYANIRSTSTEIHASEKERKLSKMLSGFEKSRSRFKNCFLKLYSDAMLWGIELCYAVESQKDYKYMLVTIAHNRLLDKLPAVNILCMFT